MLSQEELHLATEIASDASVETLDSYEEKIHNYQNRNFTYIPLPKDDAYYNTEEGWLRDLNDDQFISEEVTILRALELLQSWPFLLIDLNLNQFAIVEIETDKAILIRTADEQNKPINASEYRELIDFDRFEFDQEDTRVVPVDDYYDDKFTLQENQVALIEDYDSRYKIITLADLNSRRVKDMLYQIFAELVANLGEKIEKKYPQPDSILTNIRPAPIGRWKKDQLKGLNLHIAEHVNLIDMLNILQGSDTEFVENCGFESKNDVSTLSGINEIRNRVMHANRSLILDRKDIGDVLEAVEETERIINNMD